MANTPNLQTNRFVPIFIGGILLAALVAACVEVVDTGHEAVGTIFGRVTGEVMPADRLRVLVAHAGPVDLACATSRTTLDPGAIVVAEPGDGDIEVLSEGCALIGEVPPDDSTESSPGIRRP